MGTKKQNRKIIFEISILFALFYLPSYLFQNNIGDPSIFNDSLFNIQMWFMYIPQILLILYLIFINDNKDFKDFGIKRLYLKDIPYIILTSAALIIIIGIIQLIIILIPSPFINTELFIWEFHNGSVIPLILITSLLTGYSEELFFRSYLYTKMEELNLGKLHIIMTINIIFSLGHFYEGLDGGINAFIMGMFFSVVFLWKKNIHYIAIVHGLYNFSVLLISYLSL
ncbi:MAG: CPBP family intramembrane metalloprotease [Spirochaetaceae bacterium]|jgi:membrane protease YdiL (CAAX protease family)|nr:CPBP family intramembrane metalloprotease [Spirochaetaceae bacterium]